MRVKASKSKAVQNFRANLRKAMDAKGLSQRGMAAKSETTFSYVSKVLMGHVAPSLERAEALALCAGHDLGELLVSPKEFSRNGHKRR
jgi:transcriptional regulator with XRE-family HTH domain